MNPRRKPEAGFSLVELLMAAFVLGIGILGLTMLQLLTIRTNISSANMTRALGVAHRTLETVAMEGHRSMLWKTEGRAAVPTAGTTYTYLGQGKVTRYITGSGAILDSESAAKASGEVYYTVVVESSDTITATTMVSSVPTPLGLGKSSVFNVTVSFTDEIITKDGVTKILPRTVRLARRVSHA